MCVVWVFGSTQKDGENDKVISKDPKLAVPFTKRAMDMVLFFGGLTCHWREKTGFPRQDCGVWANVSQHKKKRKE